jgi:hypothetical protein
MNIHLLLFVSFPWWIFFPPSTIIFVVDLERGEGGVGSPNKISPTTFVAGPNFVTLFCLDLKKIIIHNLWSHAINIL